MWFYYLASLSIFFYQTMDAVDGKQARRTKTSGPLGQLFDHGCDAATCTLATSLYMQSCLVGRDAIPCSYFIYYVTSHLSFYLSQWEEQHTGILRSNFKGLGITEVQWIQIVMIIVNANTDFYLAKSSIGSLVP